jgi:hypothetical protein
MQITEPITMLTDYVLAVLCVVFAVTIWRSARRGGGRRIGVWVAAFVVTGLAAAFGGTAHGFRVPLGETWGLVWAVTVALIGVGSFLLVGAGVRSALRSEARGPTERTTGLRWLKRGVVVTLGALVILVGRVSLHEHFNHNDLYHVVQMAGLYCLYRGVQWLHALPSTSDTDESAVR